MSDEETDRVFNYKALRLLLGIIAICIAPTVSYISTDHLTSVSASYFTEARDVFVGMLIIIATFLWAYNGKTTNELVASKVASLAALCVAIFPTVSSECKPCIASTFNLAAGPTIHWIAAAILFATLAYFCFGPFRENTKGQPGKKGRRSKFYFGCGSVMVGSMLFGLIARLVMTEAKMDATAITYWVEFAALFAFGVAWLVASKFFSVFADEDEALYLFRRKDPPTTDSVP